MTPDDIERLARQADYILASEAFETAMEQLERATIDRWADGQFKTPEEREEAFHGVRAARQFTTRLKGLVEDMKLSKAQAETRAAFARVQKRHAVL
jgi:hypothetical protein